MKVIEVKELLNYDENTGILTWKGSRGHMVHGNVAGQVTKSGHIRVVFKGKPYLAHRLIWFIVTGKFPTMKIDHINGNPSDNRLANLRLATDSQNAWNRRVSRNQKSTGYKNIYRNGNYYVVRIAANKKEYTKTFLSLNEAVLYADKLRTELHGEFAREG